MILYDYLYLLQLQKLVIHSREPTHASCEVRDWLGTLNPVAPTKESFS